VAESRRIGLFGGTFDPVHFGHLRPAVEIAEQFALDTLYLMPNHRPGHRGPTSATTAQRIAMLELAVKDSEYLQVDTREAERNEATYTFDTLTELVNEQPEATIVFFLGMDSFAEFNHWHNWEGVLELANLVVMRRPGAVHSDFSKKLMAQQALTKGSKIVNGNTGVIDSCDVTQLDISATEVRRRIAEGSSIRFLLPDVVSEYIDANSLYRV